VAFAALSPLTIESIRRIMIGLTFESIIGWTNRGYYRGYSAGF